MVLLCRQICYYWVKNGSFRCGLCLGRSPAGYNPQGSEKKGSKVKKVMFKTFYILYLQTAVVMMYVLKHYTFQFNCRYI